MNRLLWVFGKNTNLPSLHEIILGLDICTTNFEFYLPENNREPTHGCIIDGPSGRNVCKIQIQYKVLAPIFCYFSQSPYNLCYLISAIYQLFIVFINCLFNNYEIHTSHFPIFNSHSHKKKSCLILFVFYFSVPYRTTFDAVNRLIQKL